MFSSTPAMSIIATLGFASGITSSSSIMQPPAMLQHKLIRNDIFVAHDELLRRALLADQVDLCHLEETIIFLNVAGSPW